MYKHVPSPFDAYDDLALVKSYKTERVKEEVLRQIYNQETGEREIVTEEVEREIITGELMNLLTDDKGFHSIDRDIGFLLGCVKQLIFRVEELEAKLAVKGVVA
jgi:hypothetical protein